MLQKLCDNCKKEMSLDSVNLYDECTFYLNIVIEKGTEITFNGDLCEDCEKELVYKIKDLIEQYGIKEEKQEINEEELETEKEEESFEIKLIESKNENED